MIEESLEKYLNAFIEKHPQIEDVVNFTIENGSINFELKDFTKFDIPTEIYNLNIFGDNNNRDGYLIKNIYLKVAEKCNESGEYTIDCFNGHYTCRKVSEIEKIHYDAMSDEEKVKYDLERKKNTLNEEISKNKEYLSSTDYIVTKINEVMAEGTEEEIAAIKAQYAEQLQKRKEARARINELEKELANLQIV